MGGLCPAVFVGEQNTPRSFPKYYWDNIFLELRDKISKKYEIVKFYKEPEFKYNKIPVNENDILLKGFFQSDKYFKHNINKIKNYLDIDNKISNIRNEYPEYFNRKTISLHFRIGDYYYLQNMHPVKTLEYYLKSFKIKDFYFKNIKFIYMLSFLIQYLLVNLRIVLIIFL